ncbi:hypothetical protein NS365_01280 [Aureimonas ureilytica]|uniref:DDE domain-containing protein n=2 Tax=Aureimonas ureilytica TaxID=401562 RepID=A0A175RY02_9HYPH|nr:hypothetical protein NS365_01280 [Aureimonas ureilytica]
MAIGAAVPHLMMGTVTHSVREALALSGDEAVPEGDSELRLRLDLAARRAVSFLGRMVEDEVWPLRSGIVIGDVPACTDSRSQLKVQRLKGVRGEWMYRYRAIGDGGETLDFHLSQTRRTKSAKQVPSKAANRSPHHRPWVISSDWNRAYLEPIGSSTPRPSTSWGRSSPGSAIPASTTLSASR